ncbi:carbohydrate ABC transporter substrate-binding protein (CUT1 family) [Haloactinopolyspora alba]|uniref:Carbohydrate ABC transporter substrate-binding protein (CUT1 family) n=1 Tax=Haloactinopolyspora alba TaxID=648780 RepID=A0A2P8EF49_9ACTN|nr:sugar ABC transporter substrate-binding protein [Haloactinopolyspora alba]PSL08064.1 carbohydrate ABC transporter substrate-binding protein (CUT1 family) [Haloactinopolyspora alba]
MQRNRVFPAVTAAALAVGMLAACSDSDDGTSGPVTIKLLEYQQARADVVEKLIPRFESAMAEQGKDIQVELVTDPLTDDQFRTKITQQFHSGTAPDVVDMGGSHVTGFAGAGYLLQLDEYLNEWPTWEKYYSAVKQKAEQVDGHYYSLPHEASVQSLFYRKDVLEEMGIDTSQPQTWDELIGRLKKVTAETGKPSIVIPAGTAWGAGTWSEGFLPIVAGTDSTFYDREAGKWTLESDGLSATFDLYAELTKAGLLPTQALLNPNPWEPTKYKQFPEGTLPVAAQGTWGWRYDWGPNGAAPIKNVKDKVATWNYPALTPGGEPYSISGGGYNYGVNAETENPDAAVELVKWLSSDKAAAEQLTAIGAAAPHPGISDVEPYKSQPTLLDAEAKLEDSIVAPEGDGNTRVSQAVQSATESILLGKADGAEAASAFAQDAAELLGENLVAK